MERPEELSQDEAFLQTLTDAVFANLNNEQFGAEQMAKEVGISRSQIHRKLQKINGKSITQFIREIRLEEALRLLQKEVGTASEISYQVGFGSPTYFNKCFHEYFGYPPGEVKKKKWTFSGTEKFFSEEETTHKSEDRIHNSSVRKLAAIMFTDIVGYTKLMGSDEVKAFKILEINREIHNTVLSRHNGTLIKEMGDGILASFSSNSDAVRCAIEIQQEVKAENIKLRIGIHEGEMVFAGADVLGDGVNVASRLEEMAAEGCINVSGDVYKDIRNKADISAEFIEEKTLKNVEEPVKMYRVKFDESGQDVLSEKPFTKKTNELLYYIIAGLIIVIVAFLIWQFFLSKETSKVTDETKIIETDKSIAVLPFDNLSGDSDQEVMCDGLTEEIIHFLSISKQFDKVISRSSVMTFKNSDKTIPEMAELLHVNFILEGSFRQSGDRLRITAQLIEASSDNHLWTEIYDRSAGDIFDIQSDIAKKIASNLKVELSSVENELIEKKPTDNLEAYNLYLKGRFHWHRRTQEDFNKSIYYFNKALELDSAYALAYAGLADVYYIMTWYEIYPENEGREKSRVLAEKALSIDDQIAEAYATLGTLLRWDKKYDEAEEALTLAIELNPNYATGHQYYGDLLLRMGRMEEARKEIDLAIMYNPYSFIMRSLRGWLYYYNGQYQEALKDALLAEELAENVPPSIWTLAFYSYFKLGMYDEALKELQYLESFENFNIADTLEIKNAYFNSGIDGVIRWLIDFHANQSKPEYIVLANLNIFINKEEEAIKWLEIGYDKNYKYINNDIKYHHVFADLHTHPRFIALINKMESETMNK